MDSGSPLEPAEGWGATVLTCDGELRLICGRGPWVLAFCPGPASRGRARPCSLSCAGWE
jgi:hypothetical protein